MGTSASPVVVLPGTAAAGPDKGSAVEQASAAARAALAERGTALPASVTQQPGGPARVDGGQPGGGQFAPSLVKELPAGAQPPAGRAPVAGDPPAPGTEGAPGTQPPVNETPEAKAARELAEQQAAAAAAGATGDEPDPLDVELPIMIGEGEEAVPLVINAGDEETAAHLRTLAEEAVSGREAAVFVEQAQRQLAQMEDMREYGEVDPVGFVTDMLSGNAEAGEHLALFLISQPTLFERLKPTLAKLVATPAELTNVANAVAAQRGQYEKQANARVLEQREIRQNVADVQQTIMTLLPADMPEAARKVAFRDMLRDIGDYATSKGLLTLPVAQIPALLRDRMAALGIDAEEAASRAAVQEAKRRMGGSSASGRGAIPARRTPPAPPARAAAPKPNGKAFVTSAAKKKEAASIPGGGAGSPGGQVPVFSTRKADGSVMSIEEATAAHRAQLAKGIRTY